MIQQQGMKRLQITIQGRVQGVFFRSSVRDKAVQLGVTGFIQNRPEGTVHIVAEGSDATLKELVRYCKTGPTYAKVAKVDIVEDEFENEFDSFFVK